MPDLSGKVAIVTGCASGIGAATVRRLRSDGAEVLGTDLDEARGAALCAEAGARFAVQDVSDRVLWPGIVAQAVEAFGRLDILVHNAGVLSRLTPVAHIEPKDWAESVAVNMSAAWRLIRTCDPPLRASDAGRAVFVTTGRVPRPLAYWGLYGAAKAGMEHLVQTWAQEVATTPLRVNLVDPGRVATKMRAAAMPGEDPATLPRPEDVAPAIAALCLPTETRHGARVEVQG